MSDHDYHRAALHEACDASDIEEEMEAEQHSSKEGKLNKEHTPIKQPNPKKPRHRRESEDVNATSIAILQTVQVLTKKMDEQTALLKSLDRRIEANTTATKENREEICVLQKKIEGLQKENSLLKDTCAEQTRYKRRWNLRIIGLTEKDGEEDTRELVIGILTRIVPMSVEQLRDTVDTVHRLEEA
ncbi:uncharacterized protein LOC114565684 [Tachysurus ichikawai]